MQLVLSNKKGDIFVHPHLQALGASGRVIVLPEREAWVALPRGSTFYFMPGHRAFGWDGAACESVPVERLNGESVFPVAGFIIPGFTRIYLPAAKKIDQGITLPLWPYTAVGWHRGKFYAASTLIDPLRRQKPRYYDDKKLIERGIVRFTRQFPRNRLLRHLVHCSRVYNCRNAQDLFLRRAEAPLPVSPLCNARCLGCLSFQEGDCAASHQRLRFVPHAEEIAQIAIAHILGARRALVSFGQGCEGEPLLQFSVVKEAIAMIRRRTRAGTIHMNTNGFSAERLTELAAAGLNSVRISLNSFDPGAYRAYYRPRGYGLKDVLGAVRASKKSGLFVSLNLLVFPGLTDDAAEVARLAVFLKEGSVDLLQLRNMSIDPDVILSRQRGRRVNGGIGILKMIGRLRRQAPRMRLGYFNRPKEQFMI